MLLIVGSLTNPEFPVMSVERGRSGFLQSDCTELGRAMSSSSDFRYLVESLPHRNYSEQGQVELDLTGCPPMQESCHKTDFLTHQAVADYAVLKDPANCQSSYLSRHSRPEDCCSWPVAVEELPRKNSYRDAETAGFGARIWTAIFDLKGTCRRA